MLTELTDHSSAALGIVTGLQFLPFLLLAPWAGMIEQYDESSRNTYCLQADRQIVAFGSLINRPVAAMPDRVACTRRENHLHEAAIRRAVFNLARRICGILLRDHDARAQTRLRLHPRLELPVIHGARKRGREIQIALLHAAAAQCDEHSDFDPVRVEMLLPHQFEVGAGRTLVRKRIDAHAARHHARIGKLPGDALAPVLAKRLQCSRQRAGRNGSRSDGLRNAGWISPSTNESFCAARVSRTGTFMEPSPRFGRHYRPNRPLPQSRVSLEGIVDQKPAHHCVGNALRQAHPSRRTASADSRSKTGKRGRSRYVRLCA